MRKVICQQRNPEKIIENVLRFENNKVFPRTVNIMIATKDLFNMLLRNSKVI